MTRKDDIAICGYFLFLALLIPTDKNHSIALSLSAAWSGPLVTTDYVLIEVANHLSPRHARKAFSRFYNAIFLEPKMTIVPASSNWMRRGSELYDSRPDKDWSLTDCISFEVMKELQLTDVLTADHHFVQAGFHILMK